MGLLPGSLSRKLMEKKPETRAELKEKVKCYLRPKEGEATKQEYLNAMTAPTTKQYHQSAHHQESQVKTNNLGVQGTVRGVLDNCHGMKE